VVSRKLPKNNSDMLNGRHHAARIVEHCVVAFWMHGRDNGTALHHLEHIHSEFAALADALGYDIIERQPATDEAKE